MDERSSFQSGLPDEFESGWLKLLEQICSQPARSSQLTGSIAEHQPSCEELIASYDRTLIAFATAMDRRESAQEKHTLRLTEFTVEVARRLVLPEFEMIHVRRGALLHDIGNLLIPEKVLLKPGPLNNSERKHIRMHPVVAYRLLSPIPILQQALDIPYSHHERWDGSGYPLGLSGEAIPLSSRIFAILDTWEALTHDRPYRPAMAASMAWALIEKLAGIWFDTRLVPVVASVLDDKKLYPER